MNPLHRAVDLAHQALGTTSPNPAVGAVVVKDGKIIGEAFTLPPGQRHAEIGALEQAGRAARGADLFTTLEPCCHFGRTPPCTQAIISAGIARVHIAAIDPNPKVLGGGHAELEAAGLEVIIEETAGVRELYEAFTKHIKTGLPFVTAKFAMSLDGKIATQSGDSKWITGPEARSKVQQMRRECDAVVVGINTVLADDPKLTARDESGTPFARQPLRVLLDSQCRTPTNAKMLREPGATLIACATTASQKQMSALGDSGAEVWSRSANARGRTDPQALLQELGQRGIVSILVEGGGTVLGSLFDAGLVDKVQAFVAPMIIGGSNAASPVEGDGISRMSDAWHLQRVSIQSIGPDWLITGYPAEGE